MSDTKHKTVSQDTFPLIVIGARKGKAREKDKRSATNKIRTRLMCYCLGMEHIRFILDNHYYVIETDLVKKERVVKMLEQYFPDVCIVAVDEIPSAEE